MRKAYGLCFDRKAYGLCFDLTPGYLNTASIGVPPTVVADALSAAVIGGVAVLMQRRTSMGLSL
jgi:hypothetical protein